MIIYRSALIGYFYCWEIEYGGRYCTKSKADKLLRGALKT